MKYNIKENEMRQACIETAIYSFLNSSWISEWNWQNTM